MFISISAVNVPEEAESPFNDMVVAVLVVDVFCASIAPSGAKRDAFQQTPEQLGKETSIETVPDPVELMKK